MPKHVVITGANSGIGAALAKVYAVPGTRLSLLARDLGRLEIVAAACRDRGCDVEAHAGDVTDAAGMESWLFACDSVVPVDLIIANAGMGGAPVLVENAGETDAARRIISVNTLGVINTVTPLLPRLIGRRAGQIAIVSSLVSVRGYTCRSRIFRLQGGNRRLWGCTSQATGAARRSHHDRIPGLR